MIFRGTRSPQLPSAPNSAGAKSVAVRIPHSCGFIPKMTMNTRCGIFPVEIEIPYQRLVQGRKEEIGDTQQMQ
jgi:hypothetical protein